VGPPARQHCVAAGNSVWLIDPALVAAARFASLLAVFRSRAARPRFLPRDTSSVCCSGRKRSELTSADRFLWHSRPSFGAVGGQPSSL